MWWCLRHLHCHFVHRLKNFDTGTQQTGEIMAQPKEPKFRETVADDTSSRYSKEIWLWVVSNKWEQQWYLYYQIHHLITADDVGADTGPKLRWQNSLPGIWSLEWGAQRLKFELHWQQRPTEQVHRLCCCGMQEWSTATVLSHFNQQCLQFLRYSNFLSLNAYVVNVIYALEGLKWELWILLRTNITSTKSVKF